MRDALKKCTIALTGDFGKNYPYDRIRHWVEGQGGCIATKVDSNVTHLVCSKEHYKKSVTMVQQARKMKTCKVVSYDWLEDSLVKFTCKRAGPYLLSAQFKASEKAKVKKKEIRDKNIRKGVKIFEQGCDDFKSNMYTDGYHIYRDPYGFAYDITLARANLLTNTNERYSLKVPHPVFTPLYPSYTPARRRVRVPLACPRTQCLQLYESHAAPVKYACYVNYSSPTAGTARHVLAPLGSSFDLALGQFERFFELKTKREWGERDGGAEGAAGSGGESEGGSGSGSGVFVYTPLPKGEGEKHGPVW